MQIQYILCAKMITRIILLYVTSLNSADSIALRSKGEGTQYRNYHDRCWPLHGPLYHRLLSSAPNSRHSTHYKLSFAARLYTLYVISTYITPRSAAQIDGVGCSCPSCGLHITAGSRAQVQLGPTTPCVASRLFCLRQRKCRLTQTRTRQTPILTRTRLMTTLIFIQVYLCG